MEHLCCVLESLLKVCSCNDLGIDGMGNDLNGLRVS